MPLALVASGVSLGDILHASQDLRLPGLERAFVGASSRSQRRQNEAMAEFSIQPLVDARILTVAAAIPTRLPTATLPNLPPSSVDCPALTVPNSDSHPQRSRKTKLRGGVT